MIPLQNGVDASERLVPILGTSRVLGGVAKVTGSIVAPGVIRQSGKHHGIAFGELDSQIQPRTERIRDVCQASGIESELRATFRPTGGGSSWVWSPSVDCAH